LDVALICKGDEVGTQVVLLEVLFLAGRRIPEAEEELELGRVTLVPAQEISQDDLIIVGRGGPRDLPWRRAAGQGALAPF